VSRSQPDTGTCRAGSHRAPNWRNTRHITNEEISFRAGFGVRPSASTTAPAASPRSPCEENTGIRGGAADRGELCEAARAVAGLMKSTLCARNDAFIPVHFCPPSCPCRANKAVRRHRGTNRRGHAVQGSPSVAAAQGEPPCLRRSRVRRV
jgi:hypothetical protein